jgi:hypothetical protein
LREKAILIVGATSSSSLLIGMPVFVPVETQQDTIPLCCVKVKRLEVVFRVWRSVFRV